jgi:two-component system, NarL family, sensor histidine kinase UhpB
MAQSLRILVVEDSEEDTFLLLRELRLAGFDTSYERVASAEAMADALDRQCWDVIISDYVLPGFGGLEALDLFHQRGLDTPFLVVSGHIGEHIAVAAIQAGADDYLMKDRLARLGSAVRHALERAEIRRQHKRDSEALAASEERFRQLAENIGVAFFMFETPTAVSPGVVSYVSPAYASIWGLPCASLLQDPDSWLKSIHPEDQARVCQALPQMAAGHVDQEFRILRNNLQPRWIHLRTFPVRDQHGRVYRLAALAEDTTERKDAEQRLRDSNDKLSQAHLELEKRVQERTADLTAANSELYNQMKERRRLENELLEIAENERRRIGFDLHDDIGQKLMGVSLLLKALETNLRHKGLSQAEEALRILGLLDQVVNRTHDLAHYFSSMETNGDDLVVLLKRMVAGVRNTFAITCRFRATPLPKLSSEETLQLYKIAQESVTNAIKHGKATRLWISIEHENDELVLQIRNDGTLFPDKCQPSNRLGLRIMDYRARTIGGKLEITAHGDSGTVVTCRIPCVNHTAKSTLSFDRTTRNKIARL